MKVQEPVQELLGLYFYLSIESARANVVILDVTSSAAAIS